jgi:selenocysteine lyase/cysteine desulfurase
LAGLVRTFEYLARVGGADVSVDARRALFQGMRAIVNRERTLSVDLLRGLRSVDGVKLYGVVDEAELSRRVPTFGFTLDGWLNADVSEALAEQGLFTWAGDHYALTLMERLGLASTGGMVRVGAVHYNTRAEVQRLVEGIASLRGRRGR